MADRTANRLRLVVDPASAPRLEWYAPVSEPGDVGDEARQLLRALAPGAPGLRVEDVSAAPGTAELSTGEAALLAELARRSAGGPNVGVVHLPAAAALQRAPRSSYSVARTSLLGDSVPPAWLPAANRVDEIWVHSHAERRAFEAVGLGVRVEVIPVGIDCGTFAPDAPSHGRIDEQITVFSADCDLDLVHGADLLLRAWAEAFEPGDPVELRLWATVAAHDIEALAVQLSGRQLRDMAPVAVLDGSKGPGRRRYLDTDVVIVPSRAAAASRSCMEAMACAKVVVATGWGGRLDFMADANSLLVDVDRLRPVDPAAPGGPNVAEPSLTSLVGCLQAATARALRHDLGSAARATMQEWSWENAARAVIGRTDAIWAGLSERRSAVGEGIKVRWQGDHFRHTSLANVNRATSLGLIGLGCDVEVVSEEVPELSPHSRGALRPLVEATGEGSGGPADVEVHFEWPPRFERSGGAPLVIFQPWEFGPVPDEWVERAPEVDEYWTPSSWSRECFVMSGVPTDRVRVMPHGVDTGLYRPSGPALPLRTTKATKLLFVGGLIWRKGVDILLDAYLRTFAPADDVCLVVKSTGFYHGEVPDRIREVIAIAQGAGLAEIEHIEEDLTEAALAALYRACDALVHPYRGEGFGLPVLEAMASGLPVAVTAYGACMDFCDSTNAVLVPCSIRPTDLGEGGGPKVSRPSFHAEVDPEDLGAALRTLVSDHEGNARRAAAALRCVTSEHTLERSVQRVHERLVELAGRHRASPGSEGQ